MAAGDEESRVRQIAGDRQRALQAAQQRAGRLAARAHRRAEDDQPVGHVSCSRARRGENPRPWTIRSSRESPAEYTERLRFELWETGVRMHRKVLIIGAACALGLAACDQPKPRVVPPDPMAATPAQVEATPPPTEGLSAGLAKRPADARASPSTASARRPIR